jgi:hypothetical protein
MEPAGCLVADGGKIPPRSGLSRAEVQENQRGRIFDGLAAALAYHGYEDTKVTDVVGLSSKPRATLSTSRSRSRASRLPMRTASSGS